MKILTVTDKKEEKFLRRPAKEFDFSKHRLSEIRELIKTMRAAMKEANGVGLSANQIGVDAKVFVAQVPNEQGQLKFYAVFNPVIVKTVKEEEILEEGCLSVPETFGQVKRATKITLAGFDQRGKKIKIKAWGLLARIFQHEVDHLNGKLFTDRVKKRK